MLVELKLTCSGNPAAVFGSELARAGRAHPEKVASMRELKLYKLHDFPQVC